MAQVISGQAASWKLRLETAVNARPMTLYNNSKAHSDHFPFLMLRYRRRKSWCCKKIALIYWKRFLLILIRRWSANEGQRWAECLLHFVIDEEQHETILLPSDELHWFTQSLTPMDWDWLRRLSRIPHTILPAAFVLGKYSWAWRKTPFK